MRILRLAAVLLAAVGLIVGLEVAPSFASVQSTGAKTGVVADDKGDQKPAESDANTTTAKKQAARKKAPDHYVVRGGVRFNEPYNRDGHTWRAVRRHILRAINSTVKGDHIRIASWNVRGKPYTDSLIKAHRRGVSVGVIMDRGNANPKSPNPDVARMVSAFKGDGNRKPADRSFVKKCRGACRHSHGIAHSKFFLFDHVGKKNWITMYGSNNATDVAAHDQWNDLYTLVGHKDVYNGFRRIFKQMKKDRNYVNSYAHFKAGSKLTFNFYPYRGRGATGDPDLQRLKQTKCKGATGGAGWNGHTKIRLAQDALLGDRGMKIAHRLVHMKRNGCDIRLIYALLGGNVRKILTAGHVPMLQYSYDRNRDGMYDIYLHMKDMAISGVFRGKTDERVVFNGTANWTGVALASDEVVGRIESRAVTAQYINWVDYLFHHRPASWGPDNLANVTTTTSGIEGRMITDDGRVVIRKLPTPKPIDPYAIMKKEGL